MMSFLVTWSSNLHILWNLPKAISLQSFSSVDCVDQVLQRDKKNNDDIMMMSFHTFEILFCKAGYKLSFKSLSYLNQILQRFL